MLFVATISAFLISLYRDEGELDARAISFTTLVLGNLALIWTNRSRTRTIPELLLSPNTALWAITGGAVGFLALVLYVTGIRNLFQFSTLHADDLAVCVLLVLLSVTWSEGAKVLARRNT